MTEIKLKEFLMSEAQRLDMTPVGIYARLKRGLYPDVKLRRVTARTIFVIVPKRLAGVQDQPRLRVRNETCECGLPREVGKPSCPRCAAIEKRLVSFSHPSRRQRPVAESGYQEHVSHLT